jgi:CDP-paratose 2-epimerase
MKQRILITGGAGFIGINATRRFLKDGWEVIIFDNFSRKGTDINLKHLIEEGYQDFTVMRNDIRTDISELNEAISQVDVVLHLAAQVAVTTSVQDPRTDFDINALGTFNVLESARKSPKKPLVMYASTNKIFGLLEGYTVREENSRYVFEDEAFHTYGVPTNHPLDFHSPYGCSKGVADQYVLDYARIYDMETVVFRQSCIYGTNQFGVEDQGWLAWFAIATILNKPLTLYGTGKQVRDALYIDDLIELYVVAVKNRAQMRGNAYAVGGGPGNTTSLLELLDVLHEKIGIRPTTSKASARAGDQPVFIADIRKAKQELGWEPKVSLNEGLDRMIDWMRNHDSEIRDLFNA